MSEWDRQNKVERDELGRIVTRKLSSEQARAMAQMGGGGRKSKAQKETEVDQLLLEAGWDNPEDAPTHIKLLAYESVRGKVPAIQQFVRHTRPSQESYDNLHLNYDEACPVCGRTAVVSRLLEGAPEVRLFMAAWLRAYVENPSIDAQFWPGGEKPEELQQGPEDTGEDEILTE